MISFTWFLIVRSFGLGLSRSSDKASEVLLYFFYGQYPWSTKKYETLADGKRKATKDVIRTKPLVFFFHKKLIAGRSRFSKNIEVYFAEFIEAFRNSAGTWKTFLTDKGEGSPPMKYNILIEDGLRYEPVHLTDPTTSSLRRVCVSGLRVSVIYPWVTPHSGVPNIGGEWNDGERLRGTLRLPDFVSSWVLTTSSGTVTGFLISLIGKTWLKRLRRDTSHSPMGKTKKTLVEPTSTTGTPWLNRRLL